MSKKNNKPLNIIYFDDNEQNFGSGVPQSPGFIKRDKKATCGFITVARREDATAYPRLVAIFHALSIQTRYHGSRTRLVTIPSPNND